MNLKAAIEREHSKAQRDKIIKYIGDDSERFKGLVSLFLTGPYRITQRAAWPLSGCVEKHPELIRPHLKMVIAQLKKPNQSDAVKRNVLRLLQYTEIPVSLQGAVADIGFQLLSDRKEAVAVHAFAITVLTDLALKLPELTNELIPIIEQQLPYARPAFISRGMKALKKLKGIQKQ